MEEKLLEGFKKKLGKEVEGLDLFVSMNFDENGKWTKDAEILEDIINGRAWFIVCTRTGNIKEIFELK